KGGESQSRELADLERLLRDRSQALRTIEAELSRRDQMVRDLVGALDDVGSAEGVPAIAQTIGGPALAQAVDPQILVQAQLDPEALRREEARAAALGEENARLRGQL